MLAYLSSDIHEQPNTSIFLLCCFHVLMLVFSFSSCPPILFIFVLTFSFLPYFFSLLILTTRPQVLILAFLSLSLFAEVGIRYFFRSPLPLVRCLKIVLPLHSGLQLSKIWYSASAGPLFRYRYFFRSALTLVRSFAIPLPLLSLKSTATSPQFCYSATTIFTEVHCLLQFAIPQFAIPRFTILLFAILQYQYQHRPPII
jgi:hypothetical protein